MSFSDTLNERLNDPAFDEQTANEQIRTPSEQGGGANLVEQIKDRLDLVQTIERFGGSADLRQNGRGWVGWHTAHDSQSKTSLNVEPDKGVWYCFHCGQGGDLFDWVGRLRHGDAYRNSDPSMFGEVLGELATVAGVDFQRDPAAAERAAERRGVEEILTLAAGFYHGQLAERHRRHLREHYGLTDQTIDDLKLGFAPAGGGALTAFFKGEGIKIADVLKTGLLNRFDNGNVSDHFQGRIIFPYWKRGRVVYAIGRQTEETPEWSKPKYIKLLVNGVKHPWVSTEVRNNHFYAEDAVVGADTVFVTEGVTDCISANQAGFPCISPVTVRFRRADWPRLLELTKHAATVYIANDSEENAAGDAGALATAEELWRKGRTALLVEFPRAAGVNKVDLNEFLRDKGADGLKALLPGAKSVLDLAVATAQDAKGDARDQALKKVFELLVFVEDDFQASRLRGELADRLGLGKRLYDRLLKTAKRQRAAGQKVKEDRSQIRVNDRQLDELVDEALQLIKAHNETNTARPLVMVHAGELIEVIQDEHDAWTTHVIGDGRLKHLLSTLATWVAVNEDSDGGVTTRDATPPNDVVRAIAQMGSWAGVPALDAIVSAPVYGPDWKLHAEEGYSTATRCYYTNGINVGNTTPTAQNVARAKTLIFDELFVDFPFEDNASRAHAVAMFLTPYIRPAIAGAVPLFLTTAPTAGTGKGLLSDVCAIPAIGHGLAATTAPDSEDEWSKQITTTLRSGVSHAVFDNVSRTMDSDSLAAAITQEFWAKRLLGSNDDVRIRIRTIWAANGNNVTVSQDLARRCIWIRLDANVEKPWERPTDEFKHGEIRTWIRSHRGELVGAALTLIRAWLDAGRPVFRGKTLGSFEEWAGTIGGILETNGIPGFLENTAKFYETAFTANDAMTAFVEAWFDLYGESPTLTSALFQLASEPDDHELKSAEWLGLLDTMLGAGRERSRQMNLGKILGKHTDTIVGGFKIVKGKLKDGRQQWQLQPTIGRQKATDTTEFSEDDDEIVI